MFWGQVDHFDGLGVELMGFWMARGIVQCQKNFKGQCLTGKMLPDFRDKALMEPFEKKGSHWPGLLVVQPIDSQLLFNFFLQGSGVSY